MDHGFPERAGHPLRGPADTSGFGAQNTGFRRVRMQASAARSRKTIPIRFGRHAPAKRKPTPGVAAGLGITLRTSSGIPPLKRLDRKYGRPPLPHVDVCLHAGGDPKSPAPKQLRRTVTGHALVELAGKKRRTGSGSLGEQPGK